MLLILLLTLFLIFVGFYLQRVSKYKIIDEYPGPSSWEIIKLMVRRNRTVETYKHLLFLTEKYGPIVKIWLKPFRPTLLVADQKFMKHILLSKQHIHKTDEFTKLKEFSGDGLPTIKESSLWKQERKSLSNVFNNKFVIEYTSTFKNQVAKLSNSIKNSLTEAIDVQPLLSRYGLNIVFELLTNEDISHQHERVEKYMNSLKVFFQLVFDRSYSLYKMNNTLFKLTKDYDIWKETCAYSKEFVESSFKRIYEQKSKIRDKSEQKDFLDLLLETGLSYDRLLDHLLTFVIAGSDTVSTCVSFALYELAKRPDMQEKIYQEYISILGENKDTFAEFRDIQQMTYTECVIKESMRIHPPVPMIYRTLLTPTEIDGKSFPADIDVVFSIIGSHRMNFDNPLEFDPERFLPENNHKNPAYGYAPFSLGPRDCIGKIIGLVESKYLLSYIIRHFTLHPVENHTLDSVGEIVLTSKTGIPIIFRERIK